MYFSFGRGVIENWFVGIMKVGVVNFLEEFFSVLDLKDLWDFKFS